MAPRPPPGPRHGAQTDRTRSLPNRANAGGRGSLSGAQTDRTRSLPNRANAGGRGSLSARDSAHNSIPASRQNSIKPEDGALAVAPMPPRQRKLIGSMTDEQLKADIGRCPVPWWWQGQKDGGGGQRAPTPHEAYAAAAMDPHTSSRSVYVHWLYAQCLGYQGFSIPIGVFGQLALTTPAPLRQAHTKLITARGLDLKLQEEIFSGIMASDWQKGTDAWQAEYDATIEALAATKAPMEAAQAAVAEPGSGPKQEKALQEAQAAKAVAEAALAAIPKPVDLPDGAMRHGPMLDLLPWGCAFNTPAEFSVDVGAMVGSYEGNALFCVLRQDGENGPWTPLGSAEALKMSASGVATVEVLSFSRLVLVWWTQDGFQSQPAVVSMLANGILAGMESRGMVPDADFRASFQLGCIAAVRIAGANPKVGLGIQIFQQPEMEIEIQDKVRIAVFADSVRKEKEMAEAAEKKRVEEEAAAAAAARIAAIPGLIKEAAKKGDVDSMKALFEEGEPHGIAVDVQDESGYTPLYTSTMYGKEETVAECVRRGAKVDLQNNNGVSPLMAAARDGYTAIVQLLLEAGADVYQVDEFERTADSVAAEKGFEEVRPFFFSFFLT